MDHGKVPAAPEDQLVDELLAPGQPKREQRQQGAGAQAIQGAIEALGEAFGHPAEGSKEKILAGL